MPLKPAPSVAQPADDALLWRFMDLPTLLSLARKKRFRLARLDSFSDRWEGIVRRVTRGPLRSGNSTTIVGGYSYLHGDTESPDRRRATAMCWCSSAFENAALWERYGRDGLGVAMKTRTRHLRSVLERSNMELLLGAVRYIDTLDRDEPGAVAPTSFFIKDRSYAFENEVRVVHFTPDREADPGGTHLDIDISRPGFNCEIVLHPESPTWFGELVRDVMNDYGHGYPVGRSALGGTVSRHEINLGQ